MFCQHCGSPLDASAQFCAKCGNPIGAAAGNEPTSLGKRFAHNIVDGIISWLLISIVCVPVSLAVKDDLAVGITVILALLIFSFPGYFLISEYFWNKTPGKFFTKSKVARTDGGRPSFLQILGRTFARMIPFEPFSFLLTSGGWHDTLSGTVVVPADYTPEQIQNLRPLKKTGARWWIIIVAVLLFGIAFIGVLSSVVLVSLNAAREKSRDFRRMADVRQLQTALELYYNDAGGYPGYNFLQSGKISCGPNTYLDSVPVNPIPGGKDYSYEYLGKAKMPPTESCEKSKQIYESYKINFTLESDSGDLSAGQHTATPEGIDKGLPSGDSQSKTELIRSTVENLKTELVLPYKLDESTTLVDITAETDAIRYHYLISDLDTSGFSNEYLKEYLKPDMCSNSDIQIILAEDIDMQYSYQVVGTTEKYFVSLSKSDC